MTRILAPWAKGLRYLGFRRLRRRNIKFGRIHRGSKGMSVGWTGKPMSSQRDHREGRPDPHAPPWGHALGIAQTPLGDRTGRIDLWIGKLRVEAHGATMDDSRGSGKAVDI
eukprot:scaffold14022_cov108-Isochrysis_galbana.AAC.18